MCIHATIVIFIATVMWFYKDEAFKKGVGPTGMNFVGKRGT